MTLNPCTILATWFAPSVDAPRIRRVQHADAESRHLQHLALAEEAEVNAKHHRLLAEMYEARTLRLDEWRDIRPPAPTNLEDLHYELP